MNLNISILLKGINKHIADYFLLLSLILLNIILSPAITVLLSKKYQIMLCL